MSGFQIHFASRKIFTPGDQVDALVAMNPAALVTNLRDLVPGGILIVDADSFTKRDLQTAGCPSNPLEDGTVDGYQVFAVEITRLVRLAVQELGLSTKEADRCRNFFAMGLVFWLYDRPLEPTLRFIVEKFGRRPEVAEANRRALMAGYHYGETIEAFAHRYRGRARPASARDVPQHHRQSGAGLGAVDRGEAERLRSVLRQLPDHARQRHPPRAFQAEELRRPHVPGRGRDRRGDLGDRGGIRRGHGRDRNQRAGAGAEGARALAWP